MNTYQWSRVRQKLIQYKIFLVYLSDLLNGNHEGLMKGLIKNVLAKRDKTNSEGKKQWPQKFDEPVRVWKTIKKRKAEMKDMKYSMFEIGQTMSRKGT